MSISTPPTNYTGTLAFILYIQSALYLTSYLLTSLLRLSKTSPPPPDASSALARRKRIRTFSALAAITFAIMSYNMLHVLFASYTAWTARHGLKVWAEDGMPRRLWQWATDSKLFHMFAMEILRDGAGWFWAQVALLGTMGWGLFMGIEGKRRNIPNLWAYFALFQIVPISFVANLFLIAMLLCPVPVPPASDLTTQPAARPPAPAQPKSSPRGVAKTKKPPTPAPDANTDGARTLLAALFHYIVLLTVLPSKRSSPYFTLFALGLRALLFSPLLISPPKSKTRPHREYGAVWITLAAASVAMVAVQWASLSRRGLGVGDVLVAIDESPPVSALGYDVLLGGVTVLVWWVMGERKGAQKKEREDGGKVEPVKRRRVKGR